MAKFILVVLFSFFSIVNSTQAFTARIEEIPKQYDVVTIENPEIKQEILGELSDAPEMFEIVSETPFKLTVSILTLPQKLSSTTGNFSGIIIKQKAVRGVEEVARLKASEANWSETRNPSTGLAYQNGPTFNQDMASGTYRIEVSTPDNHGKYILVIGDKSDDNSYFTNLANVATVYSFYGVSKIWMFSSPYVHYPVGIVFILGLIIYTYYWQKKNRTTKHVVD